MSGDRPVDKNLMAENIKKNIEEKHKEVTADEKEELKNKLINVLKEIKKTENDFRRSMRGICQALALNMNSFLLEEEQKKKLDDFLKPYKNFNQCFNEEDNSYKDLKEMDNIIKIISDADADSPVNADILSSSLVFMLNQKEDFQNAIVNYEDFLKFYADLKVNVKNKELFQLIESKLPNKLDISSYLIQPIQRPPRYLLLLRELDKAVPAGQSQAHDKLLALITEIKAYTDGAEEIMNENKVKKESESEENIRNLVSRSPDKIKKEFNETMKKQKKSPESAIVHAAEKAAQVKENYKEGIAYLNDKIETLNKNIENLERTINVKKKAKILPSNDQMSLNQQMEGLNQRKSTLKQITRQYNILKKQQKKINKICRPIEKKLATKKTQRSSSLMKGTADLERRGQEKPENNQNLNENAHKTDQISSNAEQKNSPDVSVVPNQPRPLMKEEGPRAPKYIPDLPLLSKEEWYAIDARKMIKSQEKKLGAEKEGVKNKQDFFAGLEKALQVDTTAPVSRTETVSSLKNSNESPSSSNLIKKSKEVQESKEETLTIVQIQVAKTSVLGSLKECQIKYGEKNKHYRIIEKAITDINKDDSLSLHDLKTHIMFLRDSNDKLEHQFNSMFRQSDSPLSTTIKKIEAYLDQELKIAHAKQIELKKQQTGLTEIIEPLHEPRHRH